MLGAPRAEKKSTAWLGPRPTSAIVALGARFGLSSPISPDVFPKSAPLPASVLPAPSPPPPSTLDKKGKMEMVDIEYVKATAYGVDGITLTFRIFHTKPNVSSLDRHSVTGLDLIYRI